jgi:hypothetical protein
MSHLALFKHETQAIKNPPPTFQTVSLRTPLNKGKRKGRSLQGPRALPEDETSLVNNYIDHQHDH